MLKLPTVEQLFEANAHFGHLKGKSHPKTKDYIFSIVNKTYIIDLDQTVKQIETAADFLKTQAGVGKNIILVGTKKQARLAIEKLAGQVELSYINSKWLPGTLTNFSTIKLNLKKLLDLEQEAAGEEFAKKSKKYQSATRSQIERLHKMFDGIKNLDALPDILIVVDGSKEKTAIREAGKMNIPVIGLIDTNANPQDIAYPIIINDDSFAAVELVLKSLVAVVAEGKKSFKTVTQKEEKNDRRQAD